MDNIADCTISKDKMDMENIKIELSEPICERCGRRGWLPVFSCKERSLGNCPWFKQPEIEVRQGEALVKAGLLYNPDTATFLSFINEFGVVTKMRLELKDVLGGPLYLPEIKSIPASKEAEISAVLHNSFASLFAAGFIRVARLLTIKRGERTFLGKIFGKTTARYLYILFRICPNIENQNLRKMEYLILQQLPLYPSTPSELLAKVDVNIPLASVNLDLKTAHLNEYSEYPIYSPELPSALYLIVPNLKDHFGYYLSDLNVDDYLQNEDLAREKQVEKMIGADLMKIAPLLVQLLQLKISDAVYTATYHPKAHDHSGK